MSPEVSNSQECSLRQIGGTARVYQELDESRKVT
jgi:hypothetical protein